MSIPVGVHLCGWILFKQVIQGLLQGFLCVRSAIQLTCNGYNLCTFTPTCQVLVYEYLLLLTNG